MATVQIGLRRFSIFSELFLDGPTSVGENPVIGLRETSRLDRPTDRRGNGEKESSARRVGRFVCLLTAIGSAYTGSTPALVAYLRGRHIYLDRTAATLDGVRAGTEYEAPFVLQNLTRRPIRIVGLRATCSCVVPKDYPRLIPPLARVVVPIKYHPKPQGGPFREEIRILSDAAPQPMIFLEVAGTAVPQDPTPVAPTEDQLEPILVLIQSKDTSHG